MNQILNNQLDDLEILDRVLAGEIALYEIIIRRHNPLLYKIGRSYRLAHEDVQDIMQETFITAYEKLSQFRKKSQLSTWLTRIMINKCLYKMKKEIKNIPINISSENINLEKYLPNDTQEKFHTELKKLIEMSIEKLPESYRLVFLLRETENFSVAETAEALDITPMNVKVRLNRAKAMMRDHLEKWYTKTDIYEFNLKYCSAVVENVLQKLNSPL